MHREAWTNVANKMYSVHGKTPLAATPFTAINSPQASGLDTVLYFLSVWGYLKHLSVQTNNNLDYLSRH